MVEVQVTTLWQGKVGIREGFVQEALRAKQGLLIRLKQRGKQESMVIPADEVKDMIDSFSAGKFRDQYGRRRPERLVYFVWKPMVKQGTLL